MNRVSLMAAVMSSLRGPAVARFRARFHAVATLLLAVSLAAAIPLPCAAADRLMMSEGNVVEIGVRDCVREAARAVSEEDLDAFVGCFTERQRPKIRRKAAMIFVTHSLDLELLDNHLVSESAEKAELAVKYRVSLTDDAFDVVSLLGMVNESGKWRIAAEKVESNVPLVRNRSSSSCGGPVFRFGGGGDVILRGGVEDFLPKDIRRAPGGGCANGRCGL